MKRIGIDARMFGQGFGLARYIQQLIFQCIAAPIDGVHYIVFIRTEEQARVIQQRIEDVLATHIEIVFAPFPWYGWREQLFFPRLIKKQSLDLMFFPHWNVPYLYRNPFVVAIHDLTMFHYPRPEATTRGRVMFYIKDKAHRFLLRHVVKQAETIITTTEYVKADVAKTLSVALDRMHVVYQAAFVQDTHKENNTKKEHVLAEYKLNNIAYILYLGAAYPHKNLTMLLQAWALYEEASEDDHYLILAGKDNYFYQRLCASEAFQACSRVRYIGFVPDEELDAVFAGATAFVWPSLSEGFGLSPLEALSRGIPVISSTSTCLPEVLRDGALYADPESPSQWADHIERIIEDEDLRARLIAQGRQVAGQYSWQQFGQEIQQILLHHA